MTSEQLSSGAPEVQRPTAATIATLLYAASAGVGWWAVHLVALASVSPAVCEGSPAWLLTLVNVVCLLGSASALVASRWLMRGEGRGRPLPRGARFVAEVALLFNIAATAAVVLESVPVYVLDPC